MGGDLRAHDLGPTGHEFGRGKALLGERVAQRLVEKVRQRTRIRFAGLVHVARLCHIVRHDASSWHGTAKARGSSGRARATADLLAWYDRHRRKLPWRALPGETPDPYRVWLSEIMLQQTTVRRSALFRAFHARWPTCGARGGAAR
jgi:hypothetical protein